MNDELVQAVVAIIGVPAALIGYVLLSERLIQAFPEKRQGRIRPWLWIAPAVLFLIVFLVYPTLNTIVNSFQDRLSQEFVGLANYQWFFGDSATLEALRNSLLWVVFMTGGVLGLGLLIAVLVDRVRYESVAKTTIFIPLAISFVAAAIIWKFMYEYRPPGTTQIGTVNAVAGLVGIGPYDWIRERSLLIDNFALIFIGIWMWTGFAMVILSAGLKGISTELLEAARVDGANEWQVFKGIIFPLLLPTIFVVGITIVITALKSFDIVFTLTNGAFGTDIIARRMIEEISVTRHYGRASAIAIVLLVAIIPFMALNIRRFREQEAIR